MKPVLLVEDDENDALFMRNAFEEAGLGTVLQLVFDGQQAMDYFSGSGAFADRERHPLPCLVLLDLNLPVVTGFEFLRWLRNQLAFKAVTVIVLSASTAEQDVYHAYSLGANSYVEKPSNPARLIDFARLIEAYWLGWNVALPGCLGAERSLLRCGKGAEESMLGD